MANPFAEYEAELLSESRANIEREDDAWAALPQAERDRIIAEKETRLAEAADAYTAAMDDEDDEDDPDEDDDDV